MGEVVDEQSAIRTLAGLRRMLVAYRKAQGDPVAHDHARTQPLVNVVQAIIMDSRNVEKYAQREHGQVQPLRDKIAQLEEDLAESRRPYTAQMQMQNNRIVGLNEKIMRLTMENERLRREIEGCRMALDSYEAKE